MKYCFEVKNKWVKFSNNDKYKRNKVNLYKSMKMVYMQKNMIYITNNAYLKISKCILMYGVIKNS